MDDYEALYKMIVLGPSSVGKSNVLLRYTKDRFDSNSRTTIGVEFGYRDVRIGEHRVRLQLWDTAGQERFRATPSAYYRGAVGALIVFDLTSHKSFECAAEQTWYANLLRYADASVCLALVGNKLDRVADREVTESEALALATAHGMRYHETSALANLGLESLFQELAASIYEKHRSAEVDAAPSAPSPPAQAQPVVLRSEPAEAQRKACC